MAQFFFESILGPYTPCRINLKTQHRDRTGYFSSSLPRQEPLIASGFGLSCLIIDTSVRCEILVFSFRHYCPIWDFRYRLDTTQYFSQKNCTLQSVILTTKQDYHHKIFRHRTQTMLSSEMISLFGQFHATLKKSKPSQCNGFLVRKFWLQQKSSEKKVSRESLNTSKPFNSHQ